MEDLIAQRKYLGYKILIYIPEFKIKNVGKSKSLLVLLG